MKATRSKPLFEPVTLVLESQKEVDGLYTLLRSTLLCEAVGISTPVHHVLEPHVDAERHALLWHNIVRLVYNK